LRVVFLGRISPIKNLAFALRILQDVRAPVQFNIHGPLEDEDYWRMCLDMAADLPRHVGVTHHGAYPNANLPELLSRADLLLLPTAGENFGHAIFEALSCGVPVVISDRTPWRDLAAHHAGWDLPLDVPEAYAAAIDSYAQMDPESRAVWQNGAATRAKQHVRTSNAVLENCRVLESLLP
jgi:glycosyltransferase involved in cell wall biosynthesis